MVGINITARPMREKDFIEVAQIDAAAFSNWSKTEKGKDVKLPFRTIPVLLAYYENDPESNLVAEVGGKVIGYSFAHRWGDFAYIGPLAVAVDYQNCGAAQKLMAVTLERLFSQGIKEIALETMPDTLKNIALYMKMGFYPHNLRFRFAKAVDDIDGAIRKSDLSVVETTDFQLITQLSNAICPGVDCSNLARLTVKHNLGKVCLLQSDNIIKGFFIIQTVTKRGQDSGEYYLRLIMLEPESTIKDMAYIINWCEQISPQKLIIPVYSINDVVCKFLLKNNYRIENSCIRMFYNIKATEEPVTSKCLSLLCEFSG